MKCAIPHPKSGGLTDASPKGKGFCAFIPTVRDALVQPPPPPCPDDQSSVGSQLAETPQFTMHPPPPPPPLLSFCVFVHREDPVLFFDSGGRRLQAGVAGGERGRDAQVSHGTPPPTTIVNVMSYRRCDGRHDRRTRPRLSAYNSWASVFVQYHTEKSRII